MRLLVLGGTQFLGRAVARDAAARGHDVTCAARGVSGPTAPGVRLVPVDRDDPDALSVLAGERFDAVVDVSRRPSHVRHAVAALDVPHWTYVSTCSVYADEATPGQLATRAPLLDPAPPEIDDPGTDPETYGPCKVACEQAMPAQRTFICRAGLIVGPEDPSGRFAYWVGRMLRGGPVLAPGSPDDLVQMIDVRDLAACIVTAAATGLTGVYDGIGPALPRGEFLARLARAVGTRPQLRWLDQQALLDAGVEPWYGPRAVPLWLPLPEFAGFLSRDVSPSLAAGLRVRDLAATAGDTAQWLATPQGRSAPSTGLTEAEELRLLGAA